MVLLRAPHSTSFRVPPQARAAMCSLLLHSVAVTLMFTLTSNHTSRQPPRSTVRLVISSDLAPHIAPALKGGGGGGDRSPLPASKGRLPRFAARQFTPPAAVSYNPKPILPMEPTLIGPPDLKLSEVNLPQFGDPFATPGPPSNGSGCCGGIGEGHGHGVGAGDGPGAGPGDGGGMHGQATPPVRAASGLLVLYKVEPDYSDDARKAHLQGVVILRLEVDERGMPRNLTVVRSLGLGLDERAIDAVGKWRFRPAYRDGQPAVVSAFVEVNFRLL
jgi:periplasmic protein TonB